MAPICLLVAASAASDFTGSRWERISPLLTKNDSTRSQWETRHESALPSPTAQPSLAVIITHRRLLRSRHSYAAYAEFHGAIVLLFKPQAMVKEEKRALQLPKQQLLILAICRFAEPVAMTSVYPYIVSWAVKSLLCVMLTAPSLK